MKNHDRRLQKVWTTLPNKWDEKGCQDETGDPLDLPNNGETPASRFFFGPLGSPLLGEKTNFKSLLLLFSSFFLHWT